MSRGRILRTATTCVVCFVLLSASACAPQDDSSPSVRRDPEVVVIGVAATLSGDRSQPGEDIVRAAELAVADANASAEVSDAGYQFILSLGDDSGELEAGYDVATRFVDDERLVGVVGHDDPDVALFVASVYDDADTPYIALATPPLLTEQSLGSVNRIVPRRDTFGEYAAEVALESLGATSAVVVRDADSRYEPAAEAFARAVIENGGELLESVRLGESTDVTGVVQLLSRTAPSAVFVSADVDLASRLNRTMSVMATGSILIVDGPSCSEAYVEASGSAAEGDVGVRMASDTSGSSRGRDFIAYFETTYDQPPHYDAAFAYDAVWALVQTVLEVGADREDVAEALREMEYSGVTGPFGFDDTGDVTDREIAAFEVADGEWQPLTR
jgi:branched-chain amino acid transport system substrate-binding protein